MRFIVRKKQYKYYILSTSWMSKGKEISRQSKYFQISLFATATVLLAFNLILDSYFKQYTFTFYLQCIYMKRKVEREEEEEEEGEGQFEAKKSVRRVYFIFVAE